jgi:hypothetical protein
MELTVTCATTEKRDHLKGFDADEIQSSPQQYS